MWDVHRYNIEKKNYKEHIQSINPARVKHYLYFTDFSRTSQQLVLDLITTTIYIQPCQLLAKFY